MEGRTDRAGTWGQELHPHVRSVDYGTRAAPASEELTAAAELADGDERDRLDRQAEQFASLAETGADHGRLARHENALREIEAASGDDVGAHIDAAMEAITAYRDIIEGV